MNCRQTIRAQHRCTFQQFDRNLPTDGACLKPIKEQHFPESRNECLRCRKSLYGNRLRRHGLRVRYYDLQAMTVPGMNLFPMMIKLAGRKCVVIGAGKVAAAKIEVLLSCGAKVVVIGPEAVRRIRAKANAGKLVWRPRRFSPHDLRGAFLAIAATDSPSTNEFVFRSCQARKVLCNSVDDPAHCDFFYPAVVRRGPLQIAVSTGGSSPALAARLRRELARQYGPGWAAFVKQIAEKRQKILRMAPGVQRKKLLNQIAIPPLSLRPNRTSKRKE